MLLQHGANIEAAGSDGDKPLHTAAANRQLLAVKCLLEKGARIIVINNFGLSPLHNACRNDHMDVMRVLLEKYPNTVNCATTKQHGCWTSLHIATERGCVECIELLLQHGADIEAATSDGHTPLHVAVHNGRLSVVKCLLEKGARGTATNSSGLQPLHDACRNGQMDMMRVWLEKYPDTVDCAMSEWWYMMSKWLNQLIPLHIVAAEKGHVNCIELLLQYGADIEATTSGGGTALHVAALSGQLSAVKCLLEKEVRGTTTDNKG